MSLFEGRADAYVHETNVSDWPNSAECVFLIAGNGGNVSYQSSSQALYDPQQSVAARSHSVCSPADSGLLVSAFESLRGRAVNFALNLRL